MKDPKISAVIFDMDGLIIDSEPLWKIAEIETFKEVGFDFTIEMCALTTGMRIDEVVEFWRKKLKWQNFTNTEIVDKIQNKMIQLIQENGKLLPGVIESLNLLKANNVLIALASSSSLSLINTTLDTLKIENFLILYILQKMKLQENLTQLYFYLQQKCLRFNQINVWSWKTLKLE